jgi:hypothetical protein
LQSTWADGARRRAIVDTARLGYASGMLFGRGMTPQGFLVRLGLCVLIDLADFTAGRLLGFVPFEELPITAILVLLFGWKGFFALGELADLTEQIDAFIPSATMIALWAGWDSGLFSRRAPPAPPAPPAA